MLTDGELLHRYCERRDEAAFAELVRRHLGLVHGAALRRTGGRAHLAEEIAQKVFCDLARKAAGLRGHPVLTAWLYHSTRLTAIHALRTEARRRRLNQSYAAMPDNAPSPEDRLEWTQLRPVLDEAMDRLGERDREAMLLRFFEGLSFAEVGARLGVSENAARMRTERALEKLRVHLGRRGVTSTSAALGVLLADRAFAAAPGDLVMSITGVATAVAPASGAAAVFTQLLANKAVAPALSAALAAGLTAAAWSVADGAGEAEVAALRAENARLARAAAAVAPEVRTTRIVQALGRRLEGRPAGGAGGHRNRGQATVYDACQTFWWALDTGDAAALSRILTYSDAGRDAIRSLHAGMPAEIRARYRTPEDLVIFLFMANVLLNPPPGADYVERIVPIETSPGQAVVSRPGTTAGGRQKWVRTAEGWKLVVPDRYPAHVARRVLGSESLARLDRSYAP